MNAFALVKRNDAFGLDGFAGKAIWERGVGVEAGDRWVFPGSMKRFPAGDDPAFTTKLLWLFQMKQCCHWLMVAGQLLRFIEEYDFGAVHLYRTLR